MPWLRTHRPGAPRRGAQRSAGAVAGRVHPGMHSPEALARNRGHRRQPGDGGKQSADQIANVGGTCIAYPAILCDPLHA